MKKHIFLLFLALTFVFSPIGLNDGNQSSGLNKATALTAPEINTKVAFESYKLDQITIYTGNYSVTFDTVTVDGCTNGGKAGEPSLPYYQLMFEIPNGKCFSCVKVNCKEEFVRCCDLRIVPCQNPIRPSLKTDKFTYTPPDPRIYNRDAFFPSVKFVESVESHRNGKKVYVNLYPIQYNPVQKHLVFNKMFDVTIQMIECPPPPAPPEDPGIGNDKKRFDMVIISPEHFIGFEDGMDNDFADYAAWRTSQGYKTLCYPLENILSDSKNIGRDIPERIRTFIRRAMIKWDIKYVLLGGNDEFIPTRMIPMLGDMIACDTYYSCLDGTWDGNGNSIFGEMSFEMDDDVDLDADVYVGRAPVGLNPCDMQAFISKNKNVSINKKIVQFGADPDDCTKASWLFDYMKNSIFPSAYAKLPFYDSTSFFNPGFISSKINMIKPQINQMVCHGNWDGFYNQNGFNFFSINDVNKLNNYGSYYLFSTVACCTAQFVGKECIAEKMMNKLNGGPFAYIGNTFYGWYWPCDENQFISTLSQKFETSIYKALFSEGALEIGKALSLAKDNNYQEIKSEMTYRYIFYELMLFGDPSMSLEGTSECYLKPWCADQKYLSTGLSIPIGAIVGGNDVQLDSCVYSPNQIVAFEILYENMEGIQTVINMLETDRNGLVSSVKPSLDPGKYWWRARIVCEDGSFGPYEETFWDTTLLPEAAFIVDVGGGKEKIEIINCPTNKVLPGQSLILKAVVYDASGNPKNPPPPNINWSVNPCGSLNPKQGSAIFFTMTQGCSITTVTAEYNGMKDFCTISTEPIQ